MGKRYHLASLLCHHPDKVFVSVILRGLNKGFPIGFDFAHCSFWSVACNHASSLCHSNIVTQYVAHKVSLGRLVGPVSPQGLQTSPIGLIPKCHQPNSCRMIVDLSCPFGSSVNDGIDPSLASICYASVDNAVEIICSLGPGALLTKFDLKHTYRIVPVHPTDHHKLGITWDGATFVDRCLPFSLCSAPKIFLTVADALGWVFGCYELISQVHYLDNFPFLEPPGCTSSSVIPLVSSVCSSLGVPLACNKTKGPATCLTFPGISVDSSCWELRLADDKLKLIYALIQA